MASHWLTIGNGVSNPRGAGTQNEDQISLSQRRCCGEQREGAGDAVETRFQPLGQSCAPFGKARLIDMPRVPSCRSPGPRNTPEGCSGPVCGLPQVFKAVRFRGMCAPAISACVGVSLFGGSKCWPKVCGLFFHRVVESTAALGSPFQSKQKIRLIRRVSFERSLRLSGY